MSRRFLSPSLRILHTYTNLFDVGFSTEPVEISQILSVLAYFTSPLRPVPRQELTIDTHERWVRYMALFTDPQKYNTDTIACCSFQHVQQTAGSAWQL